MNGFIIIQNPINKYDWPINVKISRYTRKYCIFLLFSVYEAIPENLLDTKRMSIAIFEILFDISWRSSEVARGVEMTSIIIKLENIPRKLVFMYIII